MQPHPNHSIANSYALLIQLHWLSCTGNFLGKVLHWHLQCRSHLPSANFTLCEFLLPVLLLYFQHHNYKNFTSFMPFTCSMTTGYRCSITHIPLHSPLTCLPYFFPFSFFKKKKIKKATNLIWKLKKHAVPEHSSYQWNCWRGPTCLRKERGGGGKWTCTRRLPSLEFGSLWSSWLFILNEIICCWKA